MLELVTIIIAGLLVLDVLLELWRVGAGVERRRQRERDAALAARTIDRTGGPRPLGDARRARRAAPWPSEPRNGPRRSESAGKP